MGKRVNFSARSVVSPDSLMDVDEVGVPFIVALRLALPEVVTTRNLNILQTRAYGSAPIRLTARMPSS